MELILGHWAAESFGMVVVSSVTASVIGRAALGNEAFLTLPDFAVDHLVQYPLFAVLGVLAGLLGVGFSRVLYAIEDVCDWAWRGPEWLRPAAGGLLLGGVLLVLPQMYGVGYPVLGDAVDGRYPVAFLLLLLVGKMLACGLTIGIGGSGGVFAPSLFSGAMLGAAFGALVGQALPGSAGAAGAYALVGMGAVFAGAARAPITAVVILFELTGEYSIILPMMLAIVLATGVGHLVSPTRSTPASCCAEASTSTSPPTLRRDDSRPAPSCPPSRHPSAFDADLTTVAAIFASSGVSSLPVLDAEQRYLGVLTAHEIMDAVASAEVTDVGSLCSPVEPVSPTTALAAVLRQATVGPTP